MVAVLGAVRAAPHSEQVPFIMISSRGDRDHIVKAIGLGVSDYLTKPFSAEELLKKVFKQLKAVGKTPTQQRTSAATTQGIAYASVDVLTGGRTEAPGAPPFFPSTPRAHRCSGGGWPAVRCRCCRSARALRPMFTRRRTRPSRRFI